MNLSPHSRNPACSAYAKADNEGSLRFLDEVLRICLRGECDGAINPGVLELSVRR